LTNVKTGSSLRLGISMEAVMLRRKSLTPGPRGKLRQPGALLLVKELEIKNEGWVVGGRRSPPRSARRKKS